MKSLFTLRSFTLCCKFNKASFFVVLEEHLDQGSGGRRCAEVEQEEGEEVLRNDWL